jgi:hypothetical protein
VLAITDFHFLFSVPQKEKHSAQVVDAAFGRHYMAQCRTSPAVNGA